MMIISLGSRRYAPAAQETGHGVEIGILRVESKNQQTEHTNHDRKQEYNEEMIEVIEGKAECA